jgi:hypothetical protein
LVGGAADDLVWLFAGLEAIEAEVAVGLSVLEDVVGADEDRVGDGDERFAITAPAAEVWVLRLRVGVAVAGGGAGALDQDLAQPGVAWARLAGAAFVGRLVVAGAEPGPAGAVAMGGEAADVGAELGQDRFGCALADGGDRVEQFRLTGEGGGSACRSLR